MMQDHRIEPPDEIGWTCKLCSGKAYNEDITHDGYIICEECDDKLLITGGYYWYRSKKEMVWCVCYIGQDNDDEQWLHTIGIDPIRVSDMRLDRFDWQEAYPPVTPGEIYKID